jgi:hypothetical protein
MAIVALLVYVSVILLVIFVVHSTSLDIPVLVSLIFLYFVPAKLASIASEPLQEVLEGAADGMLVGLLSSLLIYSLFGRKDDGDSVGRYDLRTWESRKREILETLGSSDAVKRAWALNELRFFSPSVEAAAKLYEQYSVDGAELS